MQPIRSILDQNPIVPVLTIEDSESAVPLADALHKAGLNCMEVALRTPTALDAIFQIKQAFPNIKIGASSVLDEFTLVAAKIAGADFVVSPGCTEELILAAREHNLPFLPGVSSVSEVMELRRFGFDTLKWFPAEASGGVEKLKAILGPIPDTVFYPTGGLNNQNIKNYLELDNVLSVGGSWMTPSNLVENNDWQGIYQIASSAVDTISRVS